MRGYIDRLIEAFDENRENLKDVYFPKNKKQRRERLLALARDIGYGLSTLKVTPRVYQEVERLYNRIVVPMSTDDIGTVVTLDEWRNEVMMMCCDSLEHIARR